jgi:hypothetical protein
MTELYYRERHKGEHSGPFDRGIKRSLVFRAGAGYAAGKDLASFRDKAPDKADVLVIYVYFIRAETANFLFDRSAAAEFSAGGSRSASGACACWSFAKRGFGKCHNILLKFKFESRISKSEKILKSQ